ncbi:hypothetical protein KAU11_09085 [Candidatus Babeliales bacterium]|nr:hypothetical protein [Candidatus Babeliales bacterium]
MINEPTTKKEWVKELENKRKTLNAANNTVRTIMKRMDELVLEMEEGLVKLKEF